MERKSPKFVCLVPEGEEDSNKPFEYGVVCKVLQFSETMRRTLKISVRGVVRGKVKAMIQETPFYKARVDVIPDKEPDEETSKTFRAMLEEYFSKMKLPTTLFQRVRTTSESAPVGSLADALANEWEITREESLKFLACTDVGERLQVTAAYLAKKRSTDSNNRKASSLLLAPRKKKQSDVKQSGVTNKSSKQEDNLREKLQAAGIPEEAMESIEKDLDRLERMPNSNHEYDLLRTYLEFVAALPWNKSTTDHLTLASARKQLEDDHEGLEAIKRRIVEYLAVLKLRKDMKGPILCFIGPPGTGKSSLGQSIADALGRKFHRIALGGVSDEAVIR